MSDNGNFAAASSLDLAELLCARLCHDLSGPIGAIATGAELLAEDAEAGASGELTSLLATSAQTAAARLRFLRLAFGGAGSPMSVGQFRSIADSYLASLGRGGHRIVFEWRANDVDVLSPQKAKLAANILLLAEDNLSSGGKASIDFFAANPDLLELRVNGGKTVGQAMAGLKSENPASFGPKGAQGFYTAQLAQTQHCVVDAVVDGETLHIFARNREK